MDPLAPTADAAPAAPAASRAPTPEALLHVVAGMLRELRGAEGGRLQLDDELEGTLGIDSLARMELMLRLEAAFGLRLPERPVQEARTLRDLWRAVELAAPRGSAAPLGAVPPTGVAAGTSPAPSTTTAGP
jgi:acyl carrier protein